MLSNLPEISPHTASLPSLLQTLEHLKESYHCDVDATQSSIYIYDLASQCNTYSSASLGAMLGYSEEDMQMMGAMSLAQLIHPSDLDALSAHFQRFTTLAEGEVIAIEYRMKRSNGDWCWLRSQETRMAQVEADAPLQVLGLIQNISTQKPALKSKEIFPVMI